MQKLSKFMMYATDSMNRFVGSIPSILLRPVVHLGEIAGLIPTSPQPITAEQSRAAKLTVLGADRHFRATTEINVATLGSKSVAIKPEAATFGGLSALGSLWAAALLRMRTADHANLPSEGFQQWSRRQATALRQFHTAK
jgi:hypothetical protein